MAGRLASLLPALACLAVSVPAAPAAFSQEGQAPRTEATPALALDARRLRAVYMDLAGRPPFDGERERWLGRGLYELLDELLPGEEVWRHWFEEQLYYFLLIDNFRPETERVAGRPRPTLTAGRLDVRDAIHRDRALLELRPAQPRRRHLRHRRDGAADSASRCRKNARELEIGKSDLRRGRGRFLGQDRAATSPTSCASPSSHKRFARDVPRARVPRGSCALEAGARRAVGLGARLRQGPPTSYPELCATWMASAAYEAAARRADRLQPNRLFVRALFVDLLGPAADDATRKSRRLRNALDGLSDPGPLRSVLARLLLIDSGTARCPSAGGDRENPTAWVAGPVPNASWGARPRRTSWPSPSCTAFHDPECRPGTVVYALVSHPEYHQILTPEADESPQAGTESGRHSEAMSNSENPRPGSIAAPS